MATDVPGKKHPLPRIYAEVNQAKMGPVCPVEPWKAQNSEVAGVREDGGEMCD